ncbi:MAG: Panacea domain-containing protein [Alphaproteobacteria bacterium]
MKPAVATSFDVADWFIRRSKLERVQLSPLKLHRLMYLAHAAYTGANNGEALMPSVFVASELGPIEPNLYRAFEHGTPKVIVHDPSERVRSFLLIIWERYGHQPIEALNRLLANDAAFEQARAEGVGTEISRAAMRPLDEPAAPPAVRLVRGKPVRPWTPPQAAERKPVEPD